MKRVDVKQYQVLINEQNATCGVAINIEHYKNIQIDNDDLKYNVLYNESMIKIYNNDIEIVLHSCDKQFLYYAVKTCYLGVILGKPNEITHQFVAELT